VRKYIENFCFVNRIAWSIIKWNFVFLFSSSKKIGNIVESINLYGLSYIPQYCGQKALHFHNSLANLLRFFTWKNNCLIKSLILSESINYKFGFKPKVNLLLYKDNSGDLRAHAEIVDI
jgi:hypothetical protein